jgi:transglutaminase-like putative cysteine protease
MLSRFQLLPDAAQRLCWVVLALVIAVLPHLKHLPIWLVAIAAATWAWRLLIELKGWNLPPRIARTAVACGMLACVAISYRTLNGLEAGTAFLVLLAGAKLLETRGTRDLTMLVFVSYVLLFAAFLYEQSLPLLPYLLIAAWVLTATLLRLHESGIVMPVRTAFTTTGKMLLQAIPVAVLLFLFFPRLPGHFWALPARGSSISGLSDEMSPGDVSDLSLSGSIAFRVKFDGEPPRPGQRYWRGPVLHEFDGRTWRRSRGAFFQPQELSHAEPGYSYRLTLEPSNQRWIPALDIATEWPENRSTRTSDWQLVAREPVSTLTAFTLRSAPDYRAGTALPMLMRRADLALGGSHNPRTRALAQTLRASSPSDQDFIQAVLKKFRDEQFFYTLEPPRLAADAVDEFLFDTRRGFCEHFASAFTLLMRAAGIPARVVTGYQGGEFNRLGDYLIVRQSDAHAWSEVWLGDRGWVRVDPTAAVAPERIERGLDAAIAAGEPVPGRFIRRSELLTELRFAWDAANTFWNDRIVGFDQKEQESVLSWLGVENADWRSLGIALTATIGAFFALLAAYLAWKFRPPQVDPAAQTYTALCRKLARARLPRAAHEGPSDYLVRVATSRPDLARNLTEIRTLYVSVRYEPAPMPELLSRLKYLINTLKV